MDEGDKRGRFRASVIGFVSDNWERLSRTPVKSLMIGGREEGHLEDAPHMAMAPSPETTGNKRNTQKYQCI